MPRHADTYEFPQRPEHTTSLPVWVQNTSSPEMINGYIDIMGRNLKDEDIQYLSGRLYSQRRLDKKMKEIQRQIQDGGAGKTHAALETDGNRVMLDVHQNATQTTHNGCWSVAYSAMLQSRGVDMSQQEIWAFRPFSPQEADQVDPKTSRELNSDSMLSPMDMADLALKTVPNAMMREQSFEPYNLMTGSAPFSQEQYLDDVADHLQSQIREAIEKDRSPVALMFGSHFRTVVGIEGDTVYYKEPNGDENDPDITYSGKLKDLIRPSLIQDGARGVSVTWLSDIKLAPGWRPRRFRDLAERHQACSGREEPGAAGGA